MYSNERGIGGDVFVSRAFPGGCTHTTCSVQEFALPGGAACSGCPTVVRGAVIDQSDDTYAVTYTVTKKGTYKVVSSLATPGGLTATYYSSVNADIFSLHDSNNLNKVKLKDNVPVDFSSTNQNLPEVGATGSIRWHGFVKPSKAAEYTFYVKNYRSSSFSEKVRLWVDNSLVIEASSQMGANELSGTIGFGKSNDLYDIQVAYVQNANAISGITLKWESTGSAVAGDNQYKGRIATHRQFTRRDVMPTHLVNNGANFGLTVHPAVGCATKSVATGDALTLATAGGAATFTISSKDAYENDRSKTSDMAWVVTLHGAGGTPTHQATVSPVSGNSNNYKVSYTATQAKNYEMFAKYNNDNSHGSPFALTLRPTTECGAKSTITGSGLTAAVVNVQAQFTVQARDEFANAKTKPFANANLQTFLVSTHEYTASSLNAQLQHGATHGATFTSSTVTYSTSSNGKYTGSYTITSAPSGTTFTHSTLGVAGGLLATYYDVADSGTCTAHTQDMSSHSDYTAKKTGIDPMAAHGAGACNSAVNKCGALTYAATGCYAVRYAGFLKGAGASMTARADGQSNGGFHQVFIDGTLRLDYWNSASTSAQNYAWTAANGRYYEVFAKFASATNANPAGNAALFPSGVTTAQMFARVELSGSPFDLTVTS
jgi:hypothetical protein